MSDTIEQAKRTAKAIRECAEWLAACVRLGWQKSELDTLEALWWKYHNHRGELIGSGTVPLSEASGSAGRSAAPSTNSQSVTDLRAEAQREAFEAGLQMRVDSETREWRVADAHGPAVYAPWSDNAVASAWAAYLTRQAQK